MKALPSLVAILLLGVSSAVAQQVSIESRVDPAQVEVGEGLIYSVSVSTSGQGGGIPAPEFPKFDGFNVISPPTVTSRQVNIVNNAVSQSLIYSAQLVATQPGNFVIPPAKLEIAGKELQSQPATVIVTKPSQIGISPELSNENLISAKTSDANITRYLRGKLFARVSLSKSKVYVGEPVVMNIHAYVEDKALEEGYGLGNWGMTAQGEYPGFITEEISKRERLSGEEVNIGDRKFKRALLISSLLVPTKAGQFSFTPPGLAVNLALPRTRRSANDFFDDFFSFGSLLASLPLAPQSLEVLPLPTDGKPANFEGAVGSYSLETSVDRPEAKEDEFIKLLIRFKGNGKGYASSIGRPELPTNEGFTVFDTSESLEKRSEGDTLGNVKVFEYILRPSHPGTLTIPSVSYPVFDPEKESYVTLASQPFTLKILPGENAAPVAFRQDVPVQAGSQPGMRVFVNAPEYIKTGGFLNHPSRRPLYRMGFFWAIQSFPILALGGALLYRRRSRYLTEHSDEVRKVQARGVVSKRFRAAERKLQAGETDAFCEEMSKALRQYLGDKFSLPPFGLTAGQASEMLHASSVDEETCARAVGLLEKTDTLRYAPASASREELQTLIEDASRLVSVLDKQLHKRWRALK